ncbi:hypothetical protein BGZ76_008825, partial [Entomortierella beljakovae]
PSNQQYHPHQQLQNHGHDDDQDEGKVDDPPELSDKEPKIQRRRDRTHNSSGEHIFFYDDGGDLMQAKLYSDQERNKCESMSEDISHIAFPGSASATTCSHHELRTSNGNAIIPSTSIPTTADSLPTLITKDLQTPISTITATATIGRASKLFSLSKSPARPRSRSRSRSPSRSSRPTTPHSGASARSHTRSRSVASEAWSRNMPESSQKKELLPSSFPTSRPRPSFLRGFSADSTPTQDMDSKGRSAAGSANGSSSRKATTKERLVAIVTRSTGSATPPAINVETTNGNGMHDSTFSKSFQEGVDIRSNSRFGRSSMNQAHSHRQGSPTVGRSNLNDQAVASPTQPLDGMIGFPYNNSSLLLSNSRLASGMRTSRQSKPRPFSVATMEKVLESSRRSDDADGKQEVIRHEKYRTALDRQDHPSQSDRYHQSLAHLDQENSNERPPIRPRIIGSGSHPILATLSTFHGNNIHLADEGSKGKEIDRAYNQGQGQKSVDSSLLQPTLRDFSVSNGPLHVHEHHVHHHYYCQHCPPMGLAGTDELESTEKRFNTVSHRRRESSPLLFGSTGTNQRRPSIMDAGFSSSPIETESPFALPLEDNTSTKPLVNKKKKSILGTMSMTSSMRKRFFSEQKKEQGQASGTSPAPRRLSIPFFSSSPSKHEEDLPAVNQKDGPYGPAGTTIRSKRNQKRIPLSELSDEDDDDFGLGSRSPSENNSNQQQQQRAKFLSRLKNFLLRPSPFSKGSGASHATVASTPTTPLNARAAATVRVTKSRWSRSGNNLTNHFAQDDIDSELNSSEVLPIFPPRHKTVRRWTHQDMFEPPTSTLQRRERMDIRTQFQQSSPEHQHQSGSTESRPPAQRQKTSSSDMFATEISVSDAPRSTDFNSHQSLKSPVTSTHSSLPLSTIHDKDLSDHDTMPTSYSTSPIATKPVLSASSAKLKPQTSDRSPLINASAL